MTMRSTNSFLTFLRPALRSERCPHSGSRTFSTTSIVQDWLFPKTGTTQGKTHKGRPRVPTGGSVRGTTVQWGEWGLRLKDHDRRISAKQLKIGADAIKTRLRGFRYDFYTRVSASVGVFQSGNQVRMGKGKGSWKFWAARVAVSRIVFELKGEIHPKIIRDAFRLAGAKMPGQYEIVRRGDPPVMGVTPVPLGVTVEEMRDPILHKPVPAQIVSTDIPDAAKVDPSVVSQADRLPSTLPTQ